MPKFRKKPVVIEAREWDGSVDAAYDILNWCAGKCFYSGAHPDVLAIETLEGRMIANIGDFVLQGVAGEFYPCKAAIFAATYEPVEDDEVGAIDEVPIEPQAPAPPTDHEVFQCPGGVLCEYCDRIVQYHDGAASNPDDEAEGPQQ